ncbi:hypothetical protein AAMO2058_000866900 [Amorphochlora amoebiformis]
MGRMGWRGAPLAPPLLLFLTVFFISFPPKLSRGGRASDRRVGRPRGSRPFQGFKGLRDAWRFAENLARGGLERRSRGPADKFNEANKRNMGIFRVGARKQEEVKERITSYVDSEMDDELQPAARLRRGRLPNGLKYVILPNSTPPGRCEAHLEMHVGSIEEEEGQQGVAHIVEHVTFLGSKARAKLYGTGTESNAYTDFHHTVYHLTCPTVWPPKADEVETVESGESYLRGRLNKLFSGPDMVTCALQVLRDIAFDAQMDEERINKERKAILSEISMMSTLEYRMTAKEIKELHKENILPRRLPVGMSNVVSNVSAATVRRFYEQFYQPNRGSLFLVGDMDPNEAERAIISTFSGVPRNRSKPALTDIFNGAPHLIDISTPRAGGKLRGGGGESESVDERKETRVGGERKKVFHEWSWDKREPSDIGLFSHGLLTAMQVVLCAKNPISPLRTVADLRSYMTTRIAVSGIVHALNANSSPRGAVDPPVEFDHSDSASEGCSVTTVKICSEPENWKQRVNSALAEILRLSEFGIDPNTFECLRSAFLIDAQQAGLQGDDIPSSEVVQGLIDADLLGQVFMSNEEYSRLALELGPAIELVEVNKCVQDLLAYIAAYGQPHAPQPSAILLCQPQIEPKTPKSSQKHPGVSGDAGFSEPTKPMTVFKREADENLTITEELDGLLRAVSRPLFPPRSLFSAKGLPNRVVGSTGKKAHNFIPPPHPTPTSKSFQLIPPHALKEWIRSYPPEWVDGKNTGKGGGGRVEMRRLKNGLMVNMKRTGNLRNNVVMRVVAPTQSTVAVKAIVHAVALGASAGGWGREDIDMFCMRNLLNVSFGADAEAMWLEVGAPEPTVPEAMQLIRLMMTDLTISDHDLEAIKHAMISRYYTVQNSLEAAPLDMIFQALASDDPGFREPTPSEIGSLTTTDIRKAMDRAMGAMDRVEIAVVGDYDTRKMEVLIARYLGSIPPRDMLLPDLPTVANPDPLRRVQHMRLNDSQERAIGYIAAPCPSRFGMLSHGTKRSPSFLPAAVAVLERMLNNELFIFVRDTLSLTYHVRLEVGRAKRTNGVNYWRIVVHAQEPDIEEAVRACMEVLRRFRARPNALADAKRSTASAHTRNLACDHYWLSLLDGIQEFYGYRSHPFASRGDEEPGLDVQRGYTQAVNNLTIDDINEVYSAFNFRGKDPPYLCIATAGGERGNINDD